MFTTIITAIILLASIMLVFVVYIQNPKGGGLSADFGGAQQIGGVQKTNDFIDKTTWGLAAIIGVLSVVLTVTTMSAKPKVVDTKKDQTEETGAGGQQGQQQPQQQGQQQPPQQGQE
jgi:preprotein translocase subunit SecG